LRPSRFYEHVQSHNWFAVTIDFVVVVLGVYVAVWVSNQQAASGREERTGNVVAALRQDLRFSYLAGHCHAGCLPSASIQMV